MIRLLSYFYPITKKIKSEHNGTVEITWYNGKKQLNTKNGNYSYGSLQKILKIGLKNINLNPCKNILLLGLGGGSVIKTLREDFNYQNTITTLDIDPVIISIAKTEFDITEDQKLEIICVDALKFMANNNKKFDLIIIDLFVDTEIPDSFFSESFWNNIIKATSQNGSVLFNASLHKNDDKKLSKVTVLLKKNNYAIQKLENVNQTNTLLIAESSNRM